MEEMGMMGCSPVPIIPRDANPSDYPKIMTINTKEVAEQNAKVRARDLTTGGK
jgi:hypothetical protein